MNSEGSTSPPTDITRRLIRIFKQLISEGALAPGGRLPPERDLAKSLGVSRSSLRQALKVLQIMGVIFQRVGDGTYLNTGVPSIFDEAMEFLILLGGISFRELMEARMIVEPKLAARAAERATAADIDELSGVHARMERDKNDLSKFVGDDLLFHQTIFRIADNRVCEIMFTVIHQSNQELMELTSQVVEPEHTLLLHRRILTAVRKRDPDEARRRMTEHLEDAASLFERAVARQRETLLLDRLGRITDSAGDKGAARDGG